MLRDLKDVLSTLLPQLPTVRQNERTPLSHLNAGKYSNAITLAVVEACCTQKVAASAL